MTTTTYYATITDAGIICPKGHKCGPQGPHKSVHCNRCFRGYLLPEDTPDTFDYAAAIEAENERMYVSRKRRY